MWLTFSTHDGTDVSSLNEPAFDDPVEGGSCISNDLAIVSFETLTELLEVVTSFRTCVFKQLENYLFIARWAPVSNVEVHIRPSLDCVDGLDV